MSPLVSYALLLLVLLSTTFIVVDFILSYKPLYPETGVGRCSIAKATTSGGTTFLVLKNLCSTPVNVTIVSYMASGGRRVLEKTIPASGSILVELPASYKIIVYEGRLAYGVPI